MALTVLDDILSLEREVGDLFPGFTRAFVGGRFLQSDRQYPRMNVFEVDEEYQVVAELPGVRKEDVHVTSDNGLLTINGERKSAATPRKAEWLRNEIKTGNFSREIELPRQVDTNKISAELSNGILRVVLPKAEEAKPREVSIK
jgi:HSP20 family protein